MGVGELGPAVPDHVELGEVERGERLERGRPVPQIDEVRVGHPGLLSMRVAKAERDETIGLVVGQRFEPHGVEDAEHGDGGADTESEGEGCDEARESRASERAQRETQIGDQGASSSTRIASSVMSTSPPVTL